MTATCDRFCTWDDNRRCLTHERPWWRRLLSLVRSVT